MHHHKYYNCLLAILLSIISTPAFNQNKSQLIDGRNHNYCVSCQSVIEAMPKEVLFGLHINDNGEIYFSMNNNQWFHKIFKNNSYGVSIDIVSEDKYKCGKTLQGNNKLPKGTMLKAIYKDDLVRASDELTNGSIFAKIGNVPSNLNGKKIEGNIVILNGPYICYYSNFVNIERNIWQLLHMGLFVDSLLNQVDNSASISKDYATYTKKHLLEIPFSKGSTTFDQKLLSNYFDSIDLSNSRIKKVEIRAFSSIEGPEKINQALMKARAESVISALHKYQKRLENVSVVSSENWLDFFQDIKDTKFSDFETQSKFDIKKNLLDPNTLEEIESILSRHRKVIITLYTESKTSFSNANDSSLANEFNKLLIEKNIPKAQILLKEIANRIEEDRLPITYMFNLEVPSSKEFSPLLNDREVYQYLLKATDEFEALQNLLEIRKIDPTNGKLNYNICVLRFFAWQYGNDSAARKVLLTEINNLQKQGIQSMLVKRMTINYYILKSEDQLRNFQYKEKDSSLQIIREIYKNIKPSDEEIYSLAKYYSFYSHQDWALEVIEPRISDINVSENLIFYYLNLLFFQPGMYGSEEFMKAAISSITLNKERFCKFFNPIDKGGASMQLLDYEELRDLYCSECIK